MTFATSELSSETAKLSYDASDLCAGASELNSDATELTSEAPELNSEASEVTSGRSELSFEAAEPRVTSVCMAICTIIWTTRVAHGGPRSPKCRFSKGKAWFCAMHV